MIYYAIGDVHGEKAKLDDLLAQIAGDAGGRAHKIVFLGDLIDRGDDSRGVVATAMRLTGEGRAIAVKGNHEELMLHAYERDDSLGLYHWANNGGDETIASYERDNGKQDHWREAIDKTHISWLKTLPVIHRDEARDILFVHAGIDPRRYPNDPEEVRLWTRSPIFYRSDSWPDRPELRDLLVVHGHTPTRDSEPEQQRRRINVDTGACFGGPLTSVVLEPDRAPRFLKAP
ncbi:MAG: metallophosphoesterase [Terricaulis sp.]